jgi:hypothetical protein
MLAHRESLDDIRGRIDHLETFLEGELKSTADQREAYLDGLAQQFSVLEGRLDTFKDQLDIIESLLEGDDREQPGSTLGTVNRRP